MARASNSKRAARTASPKARAARAPKRPAARKPAKAPARAASRTPAKRAGIAKLVKSVASKATGRGVAAKKAASVKVAKGKTTSKTAAASKKKASPPKKAPVAVPKKAAKPAAGSAGAKAASKPAASPKAQEAPAVKPTAAKVAPPPPPVKVVPKKPRKPELTPREIASIRENLLVQRETLVKEAADIEDTAFNSSQSDMSGEVSFDEEYADAGSFTFEREKELSIGNNIKDLLEKVDHAIVSIDRGTYGLCENCGDPINKERLRALPYSALCIRCKQQEERTR